MSIEQLIIPVAMTIGSILIGSLGYMIKNIYTRINDLEKFPAVTEQQVRQIISDKIDPVKEDVSEIRKTLDYIFNLIYTPKK